MGKNASSYPDYKSSQHNLTYVLPQLVQWLTESKHPKNETYVKTIMNKRFDTELEAKSFALRLIIHFVGDIHQPFHCANRVNDDFPEGDKGGNLFTLPYHFGTSDLHGVWDALIYEYHATVNLPFDKDTWDKMGDIN